MSVGVVSLLSYLGNVHPVLAQVDETALKAAFIYNFAMFTTWKTQPPEGAAFNVCVSHDSPLRAPLTELSGKSVDSRFWTVRTMPSASDASICQIIVYHPQKDGSAHEFASAVYANSVLLVTDGGEAQKNQAVITLALEKNHLHFDIDLGAAKKRGVSLSSNLLRLARNVYES